jgi:hypothetical protein
MGLPLTDKSQVLDPRCEPAEGSLPTPLTVRPSGCT